MISLPKPSRRVLQVSQKWLHRSTSRVIDCYHRVNMRRARDRAICRTVRLSLIWFSVVLSAQVATDSSRLRAMFGPPVKQNGTTHIEVFTLRPGVEATATYSAGNSNLCKFEIPSGLPANRRLRRSSSRWLQFPFAATGGTR